MTIPSRFAVSFAAAFLLTHYASAQPAATATGADIRVDTRLVEVDVVVRDHAGAVKGLTKDDFTVLDNGKPQRISAFSVKSGHDSVGLSKLPQGAVSNRVNALGEAPGAVTVILWDVLNTEWEDQAWMRGQVLRYLKTLNPGDRVALYRLVKNLRVVQDFTDSPDRLVKALEGTTTEQSVSLSAASLTDQAGTIPVRVDPSHPDFEEISELIGNLNAVALTQAMELQYYSIRDRAFITLDAFKAIAQHLGGLPDRKKIIWITGSFPAFSSVENGRVGTSQIESLNLGYQVQRTVEALNHANVAVYPIDARGVVVEVKSSTGFAGSHIAGGTSGGLLNTGIDTMNLLARGTGGKAAYANNDIQTAVREVVDDSELTYTLAFVPISNPRETKPSKDGTLKEDTSYHSISVKVNRKGVDVRHRRGYRISEGMASDSQRQNELNGAVQNELESTGVAITALTKPVPNKPGIYDLQMILDIHDLHFEQRQDSAGMPRWMGRIDFATLLSDQTRPIGTYEVIDINLTEPRLRDSLENGFPIHREIAYEGPAKKLRIVVQDHTTGHNGSVSIPIGQQ